MYFKYLYFKYFTTLRTEAIRLAKHISQVGLYCEIAITESHMTIQTILCHR